MTLKNIDENAIIKVKSTQKSDEDENFIDIDTVGNFYQRGGKFYIFYKESSEMQMSDSTVMLIVDKNKVTMRRNGEYETKFNFIEGESESVIYYTPFGEFNFTLCTISVNAELCDNGGRVEFEYTLETGDAIQRNKVSVSVERKD